LAADRFGHVPGGAGGQHFLHQGQWIVEGEEQHGDTRVGSFEATGRFEAAGGRQVYVEQHHAGGGLGQPGQQFGSGGNRTRHDHAGEAGRHFGQGGEEHRVAVGEQYVDGWRHEAGGCETTR
jgi:hypothetical protein